MERTKFNNIQVVRGLAALIVCVYHSRYLVNIANVGNVLEHIRPTVGIPLFYIISGFVMVMITPVSVNEKFQAARTFLVKRLIRIVPLFYFSLLIFLLINHHNISNYFTVELKTLLKTILFVPIFNTTTGPAYGFSFLYVSWSLSYELLFYVIFAISLLFANRRFHFLFGYYIVVLLIIPLITQGYFSLSPNYEGYQFTFKYLNFLTNPIQLFFGAGMALAILVFKYSKYLLAVPVKAMYVVFALSFAYFVAYTGKLVPAFRGSDIILCILFIYSMILTDLRVKISYPKFMLYLGNISYAIYLMHPLVYLYLIGIVRKLGLSELETSWWFAVIGIAIVVAVAAATHELFEKKCVRFLRTRLLTSSNVAHVNSKLREP